LPLAQEKQNAAVETLGRFLLGRQRIATNQAREAHANTHSNTKLVLISAD
jgi:hypothetical protein